MIQIHNLRLNLQETEDALLQKAAARLQIKPSSISHFHIVKKSLDARKKQDIHYVYAVEFDAAGIEQAFMQGAPRDIRIVKPYVYAIPTAQAPLSPVIVGFGPAGMFCALVLAKAGLQPVVIERGEDIDARTKSVERFWREGILNPESNVQFGEGGAGTFSDGKLTTGIKSDKIKWILDTFHRHGAPLSVTYDAKPHIGTDVLKDVVKSIRGEILSLGGTVLFSHKLTQFHREGDILFAEGVSKDGHFSIRTREMVLALGHSSRDTIEMLYHNGLAMRAKAFSMGVRIEHLQREIDAAQFGSASGLPAADYKLSCKNPDGSSAYTFCMCPGGYVVAAASEAGGIVTNGMSNSDRSGRNANAALLVTLTPENFPNSSPLGGMYWQREIERAAFRCSGSYRAPAQLVGDFLAKQPSRAARTVQPTYQPGVVFTDLHRVLPDILTKTLEQALPALDKKLKGFADASAVMTAPETRSSSPIRILRDENGESSIPGIYPCAEGAGYAGGILSAAVDGMYIAERIISKYL